MDNHPIPQDVTGFQFRLIGDMTVKQFAYVAVGGIFTLVFLYAPVHVLLRVPLMLLSAGAGLALAFMPLEGRPLDVMVGYFIKALIFPNQYAYHKTGGHIALFGYQAKPQVVTVSQTPQAQKPRPQAQNRDKERKLQTYLEALHSQHLSPLEKRESEFMNRLFPQSTQPGSNQPTPQPAMQPQVTPPQNPYQEQQSPQPQPEKAPLSDNAPKDTTPEQQTQTLALQENVLAQELTHAIQEEQSETDTAKKQEAHTHVTELEKQLRDIQSQKQLLEKELSELKTQFYQMQAQQQSQGTEPQQPQAQPAEQLQPQTQTQQAQQPQAPQSHEQQASVRKIPADMAKSLGLPHIPDVPNLILGIVKDPRGNVLSNILVEVKDQDGTPARAFRTNQLGQFASATPLSQGTYTIEFEDPKGQHLFDTIEITANNEILMPIEVISHDEREELRKALFN